MGRLRKPDKWIVSRINKLATNNNSPV
jgi:hypothetical protein